jgi:hypothetical protein
MRAANSGVAGTLFIAALARATTGAGVPAGAAMPNQKVKP